MLLALGLVGVVVVAAATYWALVLRFVQTTDDAYVGGDVTVMAPKVNGFVTDVLVHDNQFVNANQVLIRLDSRDYDARLAQANAEVQSAQAAVTELQAKKPCSSPSSTSRQAEVRASGAELTRSASDQTRYRELVKDDAVSNQVVERADADLTKAQRGGRSQQRRADRGASARSPCSTRRSATPRRASPRREAARRVAELNVEYTTIRSPVDGYVGNRTARVGMLANTGVSLLTVVPSSGCGSTPTSRKTS